MEELPKIDRYLQKTGEWLEKMRTMHAFEPEIMETILFKSQACLELRKDIHDHLGEFEESVNQMSLGMLAKTCVLLKLPVKDEKEARKTLIAKMREEYTKHWNQPDKCDHDVEILEQMRVIMADIDQLKKQINDRSKNTSD